MLVSMEPHNKRSHHIIRRPVRILLLALRRTKQRKSIHRIGNSAAVSPRDLNPELQGGIGNTRDTLRVLGSHPQAEAFYDVRSLTCFNYSFDLTYYSLQVYLAMEGAEAGSPAKATLLIMEFKQKFRNMHFTIHPKGIPGEAQGKSSNVSWAAKHVCNQYPLSDERKNVIVTVMDGTLTPPSIYQFAHLMTSILLELADSHLSTNYFAHIAGMHMAHPDTCETTFYSAPVVFDRNSQRVAAFVRVGDMLWNIAGLSALSESSRCSVGVSVYSLPLTLVDRVGGWDTDDGAITEDFHMYIKCFLALAGNLTTRIVHSPVSSTNLPGDGGTIKAVVGEIAARYNLAVRHWWGCLDIGFTLRLIAELLWNNMFRAR
jgi:hypothetical protein